MSRPIGVVLWSLIALACVGPEERAAERVKGELAERRVVVGIHGLLGKPQTDSLRRQWQVAMVAGLRRHAGDSQLDSVPFELVRWVSRTSDPTDCSTDLSRVDASVRHALVEAVGNRSQEIRALVDGVWPSSEEVLERPIVEIAQRVRWDVLQTELEEYYSNTTRRSEIREALADVLGYHRDNGTDVLLIAHSMGSMIAYDVLVRDSLPVHHFVTVGSPLATSAVKEIMSREWGPLRVPPGVARWTNLADRFDPVALDASMAGSFLPNDDGVVPQDIAVAAWVPSGVDQSQEMGAPQQVVEGIQNLTSMAVDHANVVRHHSICGYLQTPPLASALSEFLFEEAAKSN